MADPENRPTHYFYITKNNAKEREADGEYKKDDLIKLGGAWAHKDGKGMSIPLGGARFVIREAKDFPDGEGEQLKTTPVATMTPSGEVKLPD